MEEEIVPWKAIGCPFLKIGIFRLILAK